MNILSAKNKINKTIFFIVLFVVFIFSSKVFAEERITNFDSKIKINSDSSLFITETIKYDFGDVERHGIYRYIPVKYETARSNSSISLEVESVKLDGNSENYEITNNGLNKEIKIGSQNIQMKGAHMYEIVYTVKDAMNYFNDFDELYWNVTGNGWQVPIDNVNTTILLPYGTDMSKIQSSCYMGALGSKESCNISIMSGSISSISGRILNQNEGITIAIGFPKGLIFEPSKIDNIKSIIMNNIILISPIIVFLIMFFVWKKYGKDPKGYSTIIAQYEPPVGMKPTLVGSLVDERADFRDITAGLIYLAEQDFLKIKKVDKAWIFGNEDYEIELLKNDISGLEKIEKDILELFFTTLTPGENVKISDFKRDISFKNKVQIIMSNIYKEMTVKGFYEKNPNNAKLPYMILPFVIVPLLISVFKFNNAIEIISIISSGVVVFVFGLFMSKKTKLGAETKDYILGFKEFLSVTEKDRLDFHNAPDKKPEQFMKFLPYAIALGVEKKWAKQFEGIYIEQPKWYGGNVVGSLAIVDFASHISNMSHSFNTAAMGQSGSGGGGASGGGGGGGGGGSW